MYTYKYLHRGHKKMNLKELQGLQEAYNEVYQELETETVNLYDIIVPYLLDEGYAESEESAESIMENMSEEWINFVIETKLGYAAQKIANVARSKGDTGKEQQARKLANKQFSPEADPARHGKANINRARQQTRQRQERDVERPEPRAVGVGERKRKSNFSGGNF
jgi:hypothetical protein